MDDPIVAIKEQVSIVDLVERAGLTVVGRGQTRRTKEHPSLALYVAENTWYWFSQATGGDVFDWWQHERKCEFREALEELARLAGVELRPSTPERQAAVAAERAGRRILELATASYQRTLLHHPAARAAREYCAARGWADETVQASRLGYVLPVGSSADHDALPLSALLHAAGWLEHPMAKAVLSIPPDHLVYPHIVGGQVVYLSGRGVRQKRHYNLPNELAGPKRLFYAEPWRDQETGNGGEELGHDGVTVLVEGQADALSLAQWGFAAVALCGLAPGRDLAVADQRALAAVSHVALDNDEAGSAKALGVAWALNPLVQIVAWPISFTEGAVDHPVKDANDLLRAGAPASFITAVLTGAAPALMCAAELYRHRHKAERNALLEQLGAAWRNLDELTATDLEPELAQAMGVGLSQFRRLMTVAAEKAKAAEGDEPAPLSYETSAGGVVGPVVFEQCVRWSDAGAPTSCYAVRTADGQIVEKPMVDAGGTTYVPFPATIALIKQKVVLFPGQAAEYGSEKALLDEIREFLHKWLDVDGFYEQLASYYVMFTWLYDIFETLPYLRALGDYGTGKTRFIQTIGAVCYRPMFVSGASTASPIFRVIDMFRGSLIMDEADFAKSDAAVEIIKIVNVGYSRGGVVLRSERDDASDSYYPSAKNVYGPKILATRKLFEDRATESRCLTKRMTTARPRPGIPRMLNRRFWEQAQALRDKLLMYRLRNWRLMEVREDLSDASIEPRLDQVTLALKTLIADPAMLQQINHFVQAYNSTLISDRQMSVPAVVVQVLAETWFKAEQTLAGPRRDFTMKALAGRVQTILDELDPDEKVSPRRLGSLLSADLGLTRRAKDAETRRDTVVVDEGELLALMGRYGIDIPSRD